jgi:starch synthase
VQQKNLGLVADVIDRVFAYDPGVKLVVLASPGDGAGVDDLGKFVAARQRHPNRVFLSDKFDPALAQLIFAGGDFAMVPSRFEPCGLVDYEASVMGNIVVGRATGGLVKVRRCAYLYEWLDTGDRAGELNAFWWAIKAAIDTYRHGREHHLALMRAAMAIDCSWDNAARDYVEMYRYGLAARGWRRARRDFAESYRAALGDDAALFGGALDRLIV